MGVAMVILLMLATVGLFVSIVFMIVSRMLLRRTVKNVWSDLLQFEEKVRSIEMELRIIYSDLDDEDFSRLVDRNWYFRAIFESLYEPRVNAEPFQQKYIDFLEGLKTRASVKAAA